MLKNINLEEILEQFPEHVYWKNREGVYLGCNTAHWKNFGLQSLSDCIGKTDYDIFPKEEADQLRLADQEVMETGNPKIVEEGDEHALYLSHKVPLRDRNNKVVGVLGISIDITHAKKAEMERIAETTAAKTKAQIETEMRQAVTILSGSIAHDLRTPLCRVGMIGARLQDCFPILLAGYHLAKDAGLSVGEIRQDRLKSLGNVGNELQTISQEMNQFIDSSLKALSSAIAGTLTFEDWVACLTWKCISRTLQDYPFLEHQRKLVHYDQSHNFTFMGNPVLFIRVLSNLIKNSLYQIEKNQKGEIFLRGEEGDTVNILRFRDTAGGASPAIVASLFDGYQSQTEGGTGVGLAFCKLSMQSMGGDISCQSVEGDYIEFMLTFPKI